MLKKFFNWIANQFRSWPKHCGEDMARTYISYGFPMQYGYQCRVCRAYFTIQSVIDWFKDKDYERW